MFRYVSAVVMIKRKRARTHNDEGNSVVQAETAQKQHQ